jgi:hypothetical protein
MISKKDLHEVEMNLAFLLDNNNLTREKLINHFTNLMGKVEA